MKTLPWHYTQEAIHHNNAECSTAKRLANDSLREGNENIRDGTGAKPLCSECADRGSPTESMDCRVDKRGRGWYVIRLQGELTTGLGDNLLRGAFEDLIHQGAAAVIIDIEQVHDIDAATVGELLIIHKRALQEGVRLILTRPHGRVVGILRSAQFDQVFEIHGSVEDALLTAT